MLIDLSLVLLSHTHPWKRALMFKNFFFWIFCFLFCFFLVHLRKNLKQHAMVFFLRHSRENIKAIQCFSLPHPEWCFKLFLQMVRKKFGSFSVWLFFIPFLFGGWKKSSWILFSYIGEKRKILKNDLIQKKELNQLLIKSKINKWMEYYQNMWWEKEIWFKKCYFLVTLLVNVTQSI